MPKATDNIKENYLQKVKKYLESEGEEVLRTKSGTIAFPIVDEDGEEAFITLTFAVPKGSREDNEPYDAYAEADEYRLKLEAAAEKKRLAHEKKQKKIERDTKLRLAKAQAKAEREKEKSAE